MSSLAYMKPDEISLSDLTKRSCLVVRAHRLDDDPKPSFTARYRVTEVLFDAYHAENKDQHAIKTGQEIQPLSANILAEESARRHMTELFEKRGVSASVSVQPGHVYRSQLPEGERDCLLFLQPMLREEKVAFRFAAFNSVEAESALGSVKSALGTSGIRHLDWQLVLFLRPPSYRLVHRFFDSLQKKDAAAAVLTYSPDLRFSDPVFGELTFEKAALRWKMLVEKAPDLDVHFTILAADEEKVRVRYFQNYKDPETSRQIRNDIQAELSIRDDKIIEHRDTFSLWHFLSMKLGIRGRLLGFLPSLSDKLRAQAQAELAAYARKTAS